ncbi:glycosyltransferase family 4 protein [Methylobacterium soli]|uniref:Glycosyltransferase family 4 protein n=1 Tax=Methylobacterium soli TaxID=553447 RepID=A0A6L3SW09_9HYPH|nr:glycosyltransferase family 1 protein [Methylobacterium soli]KAB1078012.1 glycosyltransferase family 4 protein [Methylobacterium soli]GJE42570.1 D-inositol-3-phosphate glycosyltransferase [Methylobacterium soli]
MHLYINGRFLTQRFSGVQRFAIELTGAIDALVGEGAWPAATILVPPGPAAPRPYRFLGMRQVGRASGHLWEQLELPYFSRGGFLLNLGNTAPLAKGSRQAVVIHDAGVYDIPHAYSPAFRTWYRTLYRGLAGLDASLVTVSRFSQARLSARLHLAPDRIGIMREGSDHILRDSGDLSGLPVDGKPFVLVVGNLVAHKNLSALTACITPLRERGLALAIVGTGVRTIFQSAGHEALAGALMLGRVTDRQLSALYKAATCLIFPSSYEGFGLPAVEAMACGCPVIAQSGGSIAEICAEAALYFDARVPGSLVDALREVVGDRERAEAMSRIGLGRSAHYTWRNAASDLSGLLRDQIGETRRLGTERLVR